jgi:hypothetical protein
VPVDQSLVGRTFPSTTPYDVTEESLAAFAAATGTMYSSGGPAPATYPIVVAFAAMTDLMVDPEVGIELHRVVHGEQRFAHERSVVPACWSVRRRQRWSTSRERRDGADAANLSGDPG